MQVLRPNMFKAAILKMVENEVDNPFKREVTNGIRGIVVSSIEKALAYSTYDDEPANLRRKLFGWLFTEPNDPLHEIHTGELTDNQIRALFTRIGTWKDDDNVWHSAPDFNTEICWAMTHAFWYFTVDGINRAKGNIDSIHDLEKENPVGDEGIDPIEIKDGGMVDDCIKSIGATFFVELNKELEQYYESSKVKKNIIVNLDYDPIEVISAPDPGLTQSVVNNVSKKPVYKINTLKF